MNIKPYTPLSDKYKPLVENRMKKVENSPYRPSYHIAPPCGLLNDPNGLCYVNGKYHVFYQWYPFEAKHDMKHWNHVSSKDLVNWQEEEEILIPDLDYEKNGCYSGNAYVAPDGNTVYLYYTANFKDEKGVRIPQQALAVMNESGSIEKSKKNPILNSAPPMISENIRDPFVFRFNNEVYMLIGAETQDHQGCILLYKGITPEEWEYQGVLELELNGESIDLGTMVECPGFIQAEEDILFISLIGSNSKRFGHDNRFDTIALIGKFLPDKLLFKAQTLEVPDFGFDFYAPQPFYGKDKEPLFFGWFGCANEELPEDQYHWRHALTLPRQIILKDHNLKTPVVPDVKEQFRTIVLEDQDPKRVESSKEPVRIEWKVNNDGRTHRLEVGEKEDHYAIIVDLPGEQVIVDRSGLKTKIDPDYGFIRKIPVGKKDSIDLELFLDNSFNELYLDNGEQVLSFRSYEENLH